MAVDKFQDFADSRQQEASRILEQYKSQRETFGTETEKPKPKKTGVFADIGRQITEGKPSSQTLIESTLGAIQPILESSKKNLGEAEDYAYRSFVRPFAESWGFTKELPTLSEMNDRVNNPELWSELGKGAAKGFIKGIGEPVAGVTQILTGPAHPKFNIAESFEAGVEKVFPTATEEGKQIAAATQFLTWMVPYEAAEKITAEGIIRMAPRMIVNHPKLSYLATKVMPFLATSQLSGSLTYLTEEEKQAGVTIAEKRMSQAGMDLAAFGLFEGLRGAYGKIIGNDFSPIKDFMLENESRIYNRLVSNLEKEAKKAEQDILSMTPAAQAESAVKMEKTLELSDRITSQEERMESAVLAGLDKPEETPLGRKRANKKNTEKKAIAFVEKQKSENTYEYLKSDAVLNAGENYKNFNDPTVAFDAQLSKFAEAKKLKAPDTFGVAETDNSKYVSSAIEGIRKTESVTASDEALDYRSMLSEELLGGGAKLDSELQSAKAKGQLDAVAEVYSFNGKKYENGQAMLDGLSKEMGKDTPIDVAFDSAASAKLYPKTQELIKKYDAFAKSNGFKDALDMHKAWEVEAMNKAEANPIIATTQAINATPASEESESMNLLINRNISEVNLNLAKDAAEESRAGGITIGNKEVISPDPSPVRRPLTPAEKKSISEILSQSEAYKTLKDFYLKVTAAPADSATQEKFGEFVNFLITNVYNAPRHAQDYASAVMYGIIGDLDKQTTEFLGASIVDIDALATHTRGMRLPGEKLNERYSRTELEQALLANKQKWSQLPEEQQARMQSAFRKHFEQIRQMRERITKENGLKPDHFKFEIPDEERKYLEGFARKYFGIANLVAEDLYFPHMMADSIFSDLVGKRWLPRRGRKPFFGSMMKREGSFRPIITDYETVMKDYYGAAWLHAKLRHDFAGVYGSYDIWKYMSGPDKTGTGLSQREALLMSRTARHGTIISQDLLPKEVIDEYKKLHPKVGDFMFVKYSRGRTPILSYGEKQIEDMQKYISDAVSPEDISEGASEILNEKTTYLVPVEIGRKMDSLSGATLKGGKEIISLMHSINRVFKPAATIFNGTNYVLNNLGGDVAFQFLSNPASVTKELQAANIAYSIIYQRDMSADQKAISFIRELRENAILDASFASGENILGIADSVKKNLAEKGWSKYIEANQVRELTPKIADILSNLERVEQGKVPVLTGADPFIRSMYEKGFVRDAIFAHGRGSTVDYAAMPPAFRKFFSGGIAPFAFWYVRAADKSMRILKDNKAIAGGLASLYAGLEVYNNTGDRARWERGLAGTSYEYTSHLWMDMGGKPTLVILPDPIRASLLKMTGTARLPQYLTQLITGKATIGEVTSAMAWDVAHAPFDTAMSLASPIFSIVKGVVTNKDGLGNDIVDPKIYKSEKGAGATLSAMTYYALSQLVPQFGRMSRANDRYDYAGSPTEYLKSLIGPSSTGLISQPFVKQFEPSELFLRSLNKTSDEYQATRLIMSEKFIEKFWENKIKGTDSSKQELDDYIQEMENNGIDDTEREAMVGKESFIEQGLKIASKFKDSDTATEILNRRRYMQIMQRYKSLPKAYRNDVLKEILQ